jgi:hypothetical protein
MKNYVLVIAGFTILVFLSTFSCKNEDPDPQDTVKSIYNEKTCADVTSGLTVYSEVVGLVIVSSDREENKETTIDCPTISLESNSKVGYPKTLTCDFGSGCTYNDRTVSGSISAILSDRIRNDGTTISITFTDFKIDTIEVSGTISLTVDDANLVNGVITLSGSISDGELITPNKTVSLDGDLTITWEMNTLIDYTDDLIKLSSLNLIGTNSDNKSFTVVLEDDLIYSAECKEIVTGSVTATTAEIAFPATIDFGSGDCDGKATVTTTIKLVIGNQTIEQDYTYEIILP